LKYTFKHIFCALLSAIFFLSASKVCAQQQRASSLLFTHPRPAPEFQVWGNGGLSGLHYSISNGTRSSQFGWQAGMGFSYFFHPNWGAGVGLEFAIYHTKASLSDTAVIAMPPGNSLERLIAYRYHETQQVGMLNLPVFAQYQYPFDESFALYGKGGFKFGFPCYSSYDAAAAGFDYPDDYPVVGGQPTGFGTSHDDDLNISTSYSVFAELGVKFFLSPGVFFYAGAYIDYGLNSVSKSDKPSLFNYLPPPIDDYQLNNSMVNVNSLVGGKHLLAYGITLRLAFSLDPERSIAARRYKCCGD